MKHILICFTSIELYEYQDLECHAVKHDKTGFNDFRTKMLDKFAKGAYSQVLFIEFEIDPLNNHVVIVSNDYYKAPLKQKIELNIEAKSEKKLLKKADDLANSMQVIQAQFAEMIAEEGSTFDALNSAPSTSTQIGQW